MVNDTQLQKDIENYLSGLKAQNLEQTATFFATVYHKYVGKLAMDPMGNIAIRTDGVWEGSWGSQTKEARAEDEVKPPDDWKWSPDTGSWEYTGGKVKILANAFKKCFGMQSKSKASMGKPPYLIVSAAMVAYWMGQAFTPLTPHPPGIAPGVSNLVIFPGTPVKLGSDLYGAFNSKQYKLVAQKFTQAVVDHVGTIKGVWVGPNPGSPPPIAPVNWSGLM
jgi:hypothetical protein